MAGLRLIVGLGNPGAEYLRTRHNAGFWFIDALAKREGARFGNETKLHGETAKVNLEGQAVWLLKPNTFVNKSGIAVASHFLDGWSSPHHRPGQSRCRTRPNPAQRRVLVY